MKIIKGIGIYTLLILGALTIFGVLIFGCMFVFPNFDVFGWKVMFRSNHEALVYNTGKLNKDQTYEIVVNAGVHNVNIYQFADETPFINIIKHDDMFGFYKGAYNEKLVYSDANNPTIVNGNVVTITLGKIDGAILGRKSTLDIYLPSILSYDLDITTTTGNVFINGHGYDGTTRTHNLNVKSLEVETKSGDFSWQNINTKAYLQPENAAYYGATAVDSIDTTAQGYDKKNYVRYLFLDELNATTETGKFDFTLSNSDCRETVIAPKTAGSKTMAAVITSGAEDSAWAASLDTDTTKAFNLSAERGDFKFNKLIASTLNVVGTDVLIEANYIGTWQDFYFNVPNGYFNIENLETFAATDNNEIKTLNTIITNNINIDLETVGGELSITTTYGNINIGTLEKNASLTSTHGNIHVELAKSAISAISEKGDITIDAYQSKGYLKNTSGKINASFDIAWYKTATHKAEDYLQVMEISNAKASTTLNNAVFATKITSGGGNLNVSYYEMPIVGGVAHDVTVASGSATIKVSNLEAFKFLGKGSISGTVGSVEMKQTEGTEPVVLLTPSTDSTNLTLLKVTATGGNATFATYLVTA